ncbi:winged helix-turn-helix domain-containing protein [Halorubellus litoreus]|uniref:Winged helix-turn-helix domain-containing protein n=1 Tax=Halorubellus litoreus TaxID=755308 RepID=A0ABD5VHS5_9EURY
MQRLLGSDARAELVTAFLSRPGKELSVSEVADLADVDRASVYRHVDTLVDVGLVKEVEGGSGRSFRLQMDDELTQSLGKSHQLLVQRSQAVSPPDSEEAIQSEDSLESLLPGPLTVDLLRQLLKGSQAFRRGVITLAQECYGDTDQDDTGVKTTLGNVSSNLGAAQSLKSRINS